MSADYTPVVRGLGRVSTARQANDGTSLDEQQHRHAAYAEQQGMPLVSYREAGVSGAATVRDERARLLRDLRPGDHVVVTKLDRLGRSTRDLPDATDEDEAAGATFVSLGDAIDTGTPAGRFMRTILAAVAELERELGRERTSAVVSGYARNTGKPWGALAYGLKRDRDGHTAWNPAE